jgi:osmotically-inducible protein OsmY
MKRNYLSYVAVIGWAILIGAAKAEPAAERAYVDGSVIAQQIQGRLQAEGFSAVTKISVDADDSGAVILKGVAASDAEAARAVEVARETKGVMAVQSEIFVKRLQ